MIKMRLLLILVGITFGFFGCNQSSSTSQAQEEEVKEEAKEEWKVLFEGETLNGWRGYTTDQPGSAWKAEPG